jgi:hypothetical protein
LVKKMVKSMTRIGMTMAAVLAVAGCGREVVGVAKPEALLAWEPQAQDAAAQITTVKVGVARTYVGFSDGERFFRTNANPAAIPTDPSVWTPYDIGSGGCGQRTPTGPVTDFVITEALTIAAYAGTPGAFGIWHSPENEPCWASASISDDFLGLSVSPFRDVELLAAGADAVWVSRNFVDGWEYGVQTTSLNFAGDARAVASGVSPTGVARAWLGDGAGNVYVSDDVATATSPDQIRWQPASPNPGFPARPVIAIAVDTVRPQTVWITFAGLHADSLWTSDDAGLHWRNPHGGVLPLGEGAVSGTTFIGVSPVAEAGAAYVAALVPDVTGKATATSFWIVDGSDDWWRM